MLKLGKTPARAGAVKLSLEKYVDLSKLPTPPSTFGDQGLVARGAWGMLGNDQYGDCVWAGAAHETRLWNRAADKIVGFTTAGVLSDYSAVTGFNPNDPSTDNGTDMAMAAAYRRKTGIIGAGGNRHKVAAYASIKPGNVQLMLTAAYCFEAVGVGIEFPDSAMTQFDDGEPWSVVPGAQIEGGHYVPLFGLHNGMPILSTWGTLISCTDQFLVTYCDEALVYLSEEMLNGTKTLEGFDAAQLQADLTALTS